MNKKDIQKLIAKLEDNLYDIKQTDNVDLQEKIKESSLEIIKKLILKKDLLKTLNKTEVTYGVIDLVLSIDDNITNIDLELKNTITIDKLKSIFNLVEVLKTEKIFQMINSTSRKDVFGLEKAVLMERLAKFVGVIFSGDASKRLINVFKEHGYSEKNMPFSLSEISDSRIIKSFDKSLEVFFEKNKINLDKITKSKKADFEFEDENQYLAVLTTAKYNSDWQGGSVWKYLKKKTKNKQHQLIYVLNGIFNESYKSGKSIVLGEGNKKKTITPRKFGERVLNSFNFKVDKEIIEKFERKETISEENVEKIKIQKNFERDVNALSFLSILGNSTLNGFDKDYDGNLITVKDFLYVNPFIIGSDTYWLYKEMRDARISDNPSESFLKFILDYSLRMSEYFKNINPGFVINETDEAGVLQVFSSFDRLLSNIHRIFNPYVLEREWSEEEFRIYSEIYKNLECFSNKAKSTSETNSSATIFHYFTSAQFLKHKFLVKEDHEKLLSTFPEENKKNKVENDINFKIQEVYEKCLLIIQAKTDVRTPLYRYTKSLIDAIKDSPEDLFRENYFKEKGVSAIHKIASKGGKDFKVSDKGGVRKYDYCISVYNFAKENIDLNWSSQENKLKILVKMKDYLENSLKKECLFAEDKCVEEMLSNITEITSWDLNKNICEMIRKVFEKNKVVKVKDVCGTDSFKQIRSKILNKNEPHSNNKLNVFAINFFNLTPHNEIYKDDKITKEKVIDFFKEATLKFTENSSNNNIKINQKRMKV